jgi:hypothetical protein
MAIKKIRTMNIPLNHNLLTTTVSSFFLKQCRFLVSIEEQHI